MYEVHTLLLQSNTGISYSFHVQKKKYHTIAGHVPFPTRFRVRVIFIIEDAIVTVQ